MSDERNTVQVITLTPKYNTEHIQSYMDANTCKTADEAVAHITGRMVAAGTMQEQAEALRDLLEEMHVPQAFYAAAYALIDARDREHSAASNDLMRFFG